MKTICWSLKGFILNRNQQLRQSPGGGTDFWRINLFGEEGFYLVDSLFHIYLFEFFCYLSFYGFINTYMDGEGKSMVLILLYRIASWKFSEGYLL